MAEWASPEYHKALAYSLLIIITALAGLPAQQQPLIGYCLWHIVEQGLVTRPHL